MVMILVRIAFKEKLLYWGIESDRVVKLYRLWTWYGLDDFVKCVTSLDQSSAIDKEEPDNFIVIMDRILIRIVLSGGIF